MDHDQDSSEDSHVSSDSEYLSKTMPILDTIDQNPDYKQQVGSIIQPYVQDIVRDEATVSKIVSMLTDLPINEIHSYMKSFELLKDLIV